MGGGAQTMSSQGMKLGVEATAIWERRGKHQMKIAVFVKSLLPTLAKMVCLDIPAGWDQASSIICCIAPSNHIKGSLDCFMVL